MAKKKEPSKKIIEAITFYHSMENKSWRKVAQQYHTTVATLRKWDKLIAPPQQDIKEQIREKTSTKVSQITDKISTELARNLTQNICNIKVDLLKALGEIALGKQKEVEVNRQEKDDEGNVVYIKEKTQKLSAIKYALEIIRLLEQSSSKQDEKEQEEVINLTERLKSKL